MTTSVQNNNHNIDQINRYLDKTQNPFRPYISGRNFSQIATDMIPENQEGRTETIQALREIVKENESFFTKKTLGKTLLVAGIALSVATVALLVIPGLNVIPTGLIIGAGIAGAIGFSAVGGRLWQVTAGRDRKNIELVRESLEKLRSSSENQDPQPVGSSLVSSKNPSQSIDKEEKDPQSNSKTGLLGSRKVTALPATGSNPSIFTSSEKPSPSDPTKVYNNTPPQNTPVLIQTESILESPQNLTENFEHLPLPTEETDLNKEIGDYHLTGQFLSPWIVFKRTERNSEGAKYHISIQRDESKEGKENIAKAYSVIIKILKQHKIEAFKLIRPDSLKEGGNVNGKEFVLYVNHTAGHRESDPQFWVNVLGEIVQGLKKEGVKAGKPAKGDLAVPGGKDFVYVRAPETVFGGYIDAHRLPYFGFTREEAAKLTPSPFLDIKLQEPEASTNLSSQKAPLFEENETLKFQGSETLHRKFGFNLTHKFLWPGAGQIPRLFALLGGKLRSYAPLASREGANKNPNRYDAAVLAGKIVKKNQPLFGHAFYEQVQQQSLNTELFKPYLNKAAMIVAAIRNKKGMQEAPVGDILPAIYTHYLSVLKGREELKLSPKEEGALVRQLVIAALRTPEGDEGYAKEASYIPSEGEIKSLLARLPKE